MSEPTPLPGAGSPGENLDSEQAKRLFGAALNSTPSIPAGDVGTGPTVEEVAAMFPQLEVISLIGRGGMGSVYKARQRTLDRMVALKILHERFSRDPQFMERFAREARALARLNHPNIVSLHDFGEVNGRLYLVMEFVDGPNLREVIQTRAMKPTEALAVVPKLCDALQYAHEEGIIHRDIKPENVLIDKRGRVKIADFGLAKMLGEATPGFTLTGTGTVMGTPHYMAPEQMEAPQTVDHRADVYALGVVFYEMLTGELPLGRFQPPSKKVEINVRLDEVVLRAMDREPSLRYQHASEVRTDVEAITSSKYEGAAGGTHQPSSRAPSTPPAPSAIPVTTPTGLLRVDWHAVTAFALTFTGPLLVLSLVRIASVGASPGGSSGMKVSFAMGLPILLFPIIGIYLGFVGARNIRAAGGLKTGLGLAVFAILAIPSVIVFFVGSRIWRFIYAVGIAMDKANFWRAIGNPIYSAADANPEVYWFLAGVTVLLFVVLAARALFRRYKPDPAAPRVAAETPPLGKGPMPLWYLLLIIAAAATAIMLLLPIGFHRSTSRNNPARVFNFPSQHPIAWRIIHEGRVLAVAASTTYGHWAQGETATHTPGNAMENTYETTSGLYRLKITYLRREVSPTLGNSNSSYDLYQMETFTSNIDGSGGSTTTDIRYHGTLLRIEIDGGATVEIAPAHVLRQRTHLGTLRRSDESTTAPQVPGAAEAGMI